jgi:hypothetical protein
MKRKLDSDVLTPKRKKCKSENFQYKTLNRMIKEEGTTSLSMIFNSKDSKPYFQNYLKDNRKVLTEWMYQLSGEFEFSLLTYFLSMEILDKVFYSTSFNINQYQLVAAVSLILAGKLFIKNFSKIGRKKFPNF